MKTFIYLFLAGLVSALAFYGALNLQNPFPLFGLAFGVWALFLWGVNKRMKKGAVRRFQQRMFEQHMRSNYHHRQRY